MNRGVNGRKTRHGKELEIRIVYLLLYIAIVCAIVLAGKGAGVV